jgi:hypothetical protein
MTIYLYASGHHSQPLQLPLSIRRVSRANVRYAPYSKGPEDRYEAAGLAKKHTQLVTGLGLVLYGNHHYYSRSPLITDRGRLPGAEWRIGSALA